jgi:hypothetical protein
MMLDHVLDCAFNLSDVSPELGNVRYGSGSNHSGCKGLSAGWVQLLQPPIQALENSCDIIVCRHCLPMVNCCLVDLNILKKFAPFCRDTRWPRLPGKEL